MKWRTRLEWLKCNDDLGGKNENNNDNGTDDETLDESCQYSVSNDNDCIVHECDDGADNDDADNGDDGVDGDGDANDNID